MTVPRIIACMLVFSMIGWVAAASDNATEPLQFIDVADSKTATDDLEEYLWLKRPIVIFADSENDPRFAEQLQLLRDGADELIERDVVVLYDANPSARSDLREQLRPRSFALMLIGKDGGIKLRKPFPWSVRELIRAIDKMPLRQREIQAN